MKHQELAREDRLDSMRFIAALCVAVAHCTTAFSTKPYHAQTFAMMDFADINGVLARIVQVLFNAHSAVIIFFVLSGYVLSQSLRRIESRNYLVEFSGFFAKRLYRIIPLVVCSILLLGALRDYPSLMIAKNIALLETNISPVTWTLQVEIIGSVVVFLSYMLRRESTYFLIPLLAALLYVFFYSKFPVIFTKYMLAFFLGSCIEDIRKLGIKYLHGGIVTASAFTLMVTSDFLLGYKTNISILTQIVCAGLIVMNVSSIKSLGFLAYRPLAFLGAISYSFYLMHMLGMILTRMLCAKLGIELGQMPMMMNVLVYAVISVVITIGISVVTYYVVEKPSIKAGSSTAKGLVEKLYSIWPAWRPARGAARVDAQ